MSNTQTAVADSDDKTFVEIVALRDVSTGRTWELPSALVTVGRNPEKSDIVLSHPAVSGAHLEIVRAKPKVRIRGVGKNKPRYRGATFIEAELPAGDWIEISTDFWLQLVTDDMQVETHAARFFLGMSNHHDISMLLYAAARRRPLVLVGRTSTGRGILAKRIHGMASRAPEAFVIVDKHVRGVNLVSLLRLHGEITAYVDLSKVKELDIDGMRELAKVPEAPIQWIFAAPTMDFAVDVVLAHMLDASAEKTRFELVNLKHRDEDRMDLVALVMDAHGWGKALDELPQERVRRVVHHPETATLEDLWMAPLRLLALEQTGGDVTKASGLLKAWGYEKLQGRTALESWVFNLDIDTRVGR